ncbi:MAG TPA: SurA N-terminal domain-containing protein [Verrucomicrobiae bacterium]|nr:SurA N-terminal domain-containing protein [Verrucomicrobiae bacterium]
MFKFALAIALTAGMLPTARAGDVIDRIVATINGHVILQSDWDNALRYEALLNGRAPSEFTEDERRSVLDRLVDQELLGEQIKSSVFAQATEAEAQARIAEARKHYSDAASDEGWRVVLNRFGLTQQELVSHVESQINLMRLVDAHLRPAVQIDSKTIEAYYRDKFVPQLKQSGAGEVPLNEVSGKIRELLTEEKVNELLVSWLQTLRSESKVSFANGTLADGAQAR